MEFLQDIFLDAVHDTWLMLPLLYLAYVLIETFERRPSEDDGIFWRLQKYGPLFGALLGLIPQCGFSIIGAMLFIQNNITLGTLLALFIATSDEAVPILISEPQMIPSLIALLIGKFIAAILVGYFVDKVLFRHQKILLFSEMPEEEEEDEMAEDEEAGSGCPCCYPQYPLWLSALIRTLKIYIFAFLVTLALNALTAWIGEEQLSSFLMSGIWMQPALAALFGLIPNCAATVVLCQLYAGGALTFASLFAGLASNAGMGLVVLLRYSENRKEFWKVLLLLLGAAMILGYLLQLILAYTPVPIGI